MKARLIRAKQAGVNLCSNIHARAYLGVLASLCYVLVGCSEAPEADARLDQYKKITNEAFVNNQGSLSVKNELATQLGYDNKDIILVLGDSLSAAYRMAKEQGWVNLLRERLSSQAGYSHYAVINASVSGSTTAAGLQSLPSLLQAHEPRIVILELGANDGLQGKPISYIRNNLSELLSTIAAYGAEAVLIGNHLPPNYGKAYTQPFFEQYANLAQQFGVAYVPFLLEGVAKNRALMMSDGLHPLPDAQEKVLDNVWLELKSVLKN